MAKSSAIAIIDVELQNPVISAEDVRINMADRSDGKYRMQIRLSFLQHNRQRAIVTI
jgi:nitrogen fixation protein FixH